MLNKKRREQSVIFNEKLKHRLLEGVFIVVVAFSLFMLLALFTYDNKDPSWSHVASRFGVSNMGGYAGALLADTFFCLIGYVAYLVPLLFSYSAWKLWRSYGDDNVNAFTVAVRFFSFLLLCFSVSSLASINLKSEYLPFGSGGFLGSVLSNTLLHVANFAGANLILCALFLSSMTLFTGISWVRIAEILGLFLLSSVDFLGRKFLHIRWIDLFRGVFLDAKENKIAPKIPSKKLQFAEDFLNTEESFEAVEEKIESKIPPVISQFSIKPSRRSEEEKQLSLFEPELDGSLPPLALLDLPEVQIGEEYTREELERMSREVELRLADFGVDVAVVAVHPGPVVTRFELQPSAGTKVSKITVLAKDLARSLSVVSVRIVEVIPGKSVIGLELPNKHREIVRLREILSSQQYESARSPLTIALGKDISGYPVIVDLAKMPHLLVAGTTGSGKSVCLNAILLSLLYKYTSKEARLILIDPKMLELSIYDGIAHLLAPVVTDMKDATNALRWCVYEMERRYRLLAALGVRNLNGYNHKIKEAREKGVPLFDPLWQEGMPGEGPKELEELPYIVVLADEYADMIMVVGKKVEELIARIAQKARASGIHLILATQRPSVDVVTGLIKANVPTRIAFQVSSKIDSRTILDQGGAEQLLGFGDMLYLPPGSGVPIRVHGAFVDDDEVHRVVKDLKRRAEPIYLDEVLDGFADGGVSSDSVSSMQNLSGADFSFSEKDAEQDPLYDQAVKIVLETRRASISQVQRRLRIGYNRAARMIEDMEKAGLVSAMENNGSREVLVPAQELVEEYDAF